MPVKTGGIEEIRQISCVDVTVSVTSACGGTGEHVSHACAGRGIARTRHAPLPVAPVLRTRSAPSARNPAQSRLSATGSFFRRHIRCRRSRRIDVSGMKKPVSASSGTQVRMSFAKSVLTRARANALGIASDSDERDAHSGSTGPIVISAVGELDLSTVDSFRSTVMDAVGDSASSSVVIDLTQVTFIDSTTLSVLVGAHKELSAQDRQLTIRTRQPLVLRLFDITGLSSLLKIEA